MFNKIWEQRKEIVNTRLKNNEQPFALYFAFTKTHD